MSYYRRGYNQNYQPKPKSGDPTMFNIPAAVKPWIETTQHTNTLLQSICDQLVKYGHLTEKQWQIAHKEMNGKPASVILPPVTITTPLPVFINRTAAFREIRDKYKLQYGVFAIKMTKVLKAGKARNGNTWAELEVIPDTDTPVSCCRICGKTLKDQRSITSGIGPDCAKRLGAAYNSYKSSNLQQFIADFKKEISKVGTMTIKLWGNQVKENIANFDFAVASYMNQPAGAIATTAAIGSSTNNTVAVATNPPTTAKVDECIIVMDNSKFKVLDATSKDNVQKVPNPYRFAMEVHSADLEIMPRTSLGTTVANIADVNLIILKNPQTGNRVTFNRMSRNQFAGVNSGSAILLTII